MPSIYAPTQQNNNNNTSGTIPGTKSKDITVYATNVITDPTRQFVTQEEKNALANMLDAITGTARKVMYKEVYDKTDNGSVDLAKKALVAESVDWENIVNKPIINDDSNPDEESGNKSILDNLSEISGQLAYKDKVLITDISKCMQTTIYDIDNDGIIDKAKYAESTNWANIINKPLLFTPSQHRHDISDISGNINAVSLNGLNSDEFLKKSDKIRLSQIEDINDADFSMLSINGGKAASNYENTTNAETQIQLRSDTDKFWNQINPILKECEIGINLDDFRYKIGDGKNEWNRLPYTYNTPNTIRLNKIIKSFINCRTDNEVSISLTDISELINIDTGSIQYNDTILGYNNCLIGIPYNASKVLFVSSDLSVINTFGGSFDTINSKGAGWFSGVSDLNGIIYCAPYNSNCILAIDSNNKTVTTFADYEFQSNKNNKYTRGAYCSLNNKIYFAPHNANAILEIDPNTQEVKFYKNENIFDNDKNCCDVIYNSFDEKLYFIPKYGTKIVQFDPISKIIKVVANTKGDTINKFSCAVLAPNGKIYIIPSNGYSTFTIFDPITYDLEEISFVTNSYDYYNNAILAPNGKIYMIPSGITSRSIIAFNTNSDVGEITYNILNSNDRWSGGALLPDGRIICLPYTSNSILTIDTKINNTIDSKALQIFN